MNQIVTIPRRIAEKGELVVLPRKTYEELLRLTKISTRRHGKLDQDLEKSLQEFRAGKTIGPFSNAKDLIKSLRSNGRR